MPLSKRPNARRRQLANLRPRTSGELVGNRNAASHFGYAQIGRERLEAEERRVLDALGEDVPLKNPDGSPPAADAVMISMLARALIRLERVEGYHRDHGWQTDSGDPRPSVELEGRLRREVADYCDALGMSPRSRARLGLDLQRQAAFDLASYWSEDEAIEGEAEDE